MMLGIIKSIKEVHNIVAKPIGTVKGKYQKLRFIQVANAVWGSDYYMDGYKVETDKHNYYVLIDNGQSCCESWGYISSEDDYKQFIGAKLLEVNLTDRALNKEYVEQSNYYKEHGGIQFVDFVTDNGVFQLAVYNAHNGYYGHDIIIAKDNNVLLKKIL